MWEQHVILHHIGKHDVGHSSELLFLFLLQQNNTFIYINNNNHDTQQYYKVTFDSKRSSVPL